MITLEIGFCACGGDRVGALGNCTERRDKKVGGCCRWRYSPERTSTSGMVYVCLSPVEITSASSCSCPSSSTGAFDLEHRKLNIGATMLILKSPLLSKPVNESVKWHMHEILHSLFRKRDAFAENRRMSQHTSAYSTDNAASKHKSLHSIPARRQNIR